MGYVFDFKDALNYEKWFFSPENQIAVHPENRLMLRMLQPVRGRSMIDIGCGTGARLKPFLEEGLHIDGLDPSPYMLNIAKEKYGNQVELHRGFGESLPFEDNSFHYASLIATLEYVQDPIKVLEESFRVAKDKVLIGIYNRHAVTCLQRRIRGMFVETIYNRARFFSIWEVKGMIGKVIGDVPVSWKTVCRFPSVVQKYIGPSEYPALFQKFPFGSFAGILVLPVPKFRTKALTLTFNAKRSRAPSIQPIQTTDRQRETTPCTRASEKGTDDGSLSLRTVG